jgi:ubiquitin-conjugating enzyme E2 O
MDLAAEEAAVSPKIYLLDLVRFEPQPGGSFDRGLVIPFKVLHNPNNQSVPASNFSILCADAAVTTVNPGDVTLLDRSYIGPGHAVASASDLGGQIGIVTGVTTALDLMQLGDPTAVIQGLSPSDLRRVRGLCLGDYVVSGRWLGRVVEVSLDVDVLFDDGAVCKVTDAESKKLQSAETHASYRPQTNTLLYPGKRVMGDPYAVFKASRWLNGHWKASREVGTVCKVEMAGVLVYWITSALCRNDQQQESAPPPAYQSPDNLTFFCPESGCAWAVADRCFLRGSPEPRNGGTHHHDAASSPDDIIDVLRQPPDGSSEEESDELPSMMTDDDGHAHTMLNTSKKRQTERTSYPKQLRKYLFIGQRRTRREDRRQTELKLPMIVSNTRTTVDVLWQDGTLQRGVPSSSVVPFVTLNEHEFFPGQYVVDNAPAAAGDGRLGIVRSLNCKDKTVRVSWFKAAGCLQEVECDDTVSAYDLGIDRDRCVFYGDVVTRPLPLGSTNDGCTASVQQPLARGHRNRAATSDLSWVGRVVDLPDGHVQVEWGDGSMSTVCRIALHLLSVGLTAA